MHMADALLSPAVGATMWAATGIVLAASARRVREAGEDRLIPLMGVLGAFVFAAQMINFAIPATGSSGHIGGGLLLSVLLGPAAAFVVIASVLSVQALFFADGGLLALGANIFNLGAFPCFVAYPLVYGAIVRPGAASARVWFGAVLAAVVGLQLGALAVVMQTVASGISSLPAGPFLWLMLPVHLAIGGVEGLATAALLLFIRRTRPDLVERCVGSAAKASPTRPLVVAVALAAAVTGGVLPWFASAQPDGLEWSLERAAGGKVAQRPDGGVHERLATVQERIAVMPDYGPLPAAMTAGDEPTWPAVSPAKSLAGLVGGFATLLLVMLATLALRRRR
jgi:cobalt/nickel transport system permease protein